VEIIAVMLREAAPIAARVVFKLVQIFIPAEQPVRTEQRAQDKVSPVPNVHPHSTEVRDGNVLKIYYN
jgi:hypothetical protein